MEAILYIGHGTRSKKGSEEARAFMEKVIKKTKVPIQEFSFLELTAPSIEEGFQSCVESGATNITVVPIFLLAAGHIKNDIPKVIALMQKKYPDVTVRIRNPFGIQEVIMDALVEIIKEQAGRVTPKDTLLIVGRGSSDPEIHSSFQRIVEGMQERLPVSHVSVCYLAAAEPSLQDGLDGAVKRARGRIIVLPYLLFSGLLLSEISQKVRRLKQQGVSILHTGPLTTSKVFEEIIVNEWCLTPEYAGA